MKEGEGSVLDNTAFFTGAATMGHNNNNYPWFSRVAKTGHEHGQYLQVRIRRSFANLFVTIQAWAQGRFLRRQHGRDEGSPCLVALSLEVSQEVENLLLARLFNKPGGMMDSSERLLLRTSTFRILIA